MKRMNCEKISSWRETQQKLNSFWVTFLHENQQMTQGFFPASRGGHFNRLRDDRRFIYFLYKKIETDWATFSAGALLSGRLLFTLHKSLKISFDVTSSWRAVFYAAHLPEKRDAWREKVKVFFVEKIRENGATIGEKVSLMMFFPFDYCS